MSRIETFFPSLGQDLGKIDARNPSSTKKGPGRKHKQGHAKNEGSKPKFKRYTMKTVKVTQQTDNVTNTPLKAATRGG